MSFNLRIQFWLGLVCLIDSDWKSIQFFSCKKKKMFEEYWYKSKENRTIKELGIDDTDDVELLVDQIKY